MSLLFSLAVALPFACLALLSLISLVVITAIGCVIHVLGAARRPTTLPVPSRHQFAADHVNAAAPGR
jgi:hypothetical protein